MFKKQMLAVKYQIHFSNALLRNLNIFHSFFSEACAKFISANTVKEISRLLPTEVRIYTHIRALEYYNGNLLRNIR